MGSDRSVFLSRGLTLSELLIATTIVTVVLLGLGVAGVAMKKMDTGYVRDTALYMKLAAIGEDIRLSALEARGTRKDPGIFVDSSIYKMCFRYRITEDPNVKDWRCYSFLPDESPQTKFYSCNLYEPGACTDKGRRTYLGDLNQDVFSTSGSNKYCNAPTFDASLNTEDHNLRFKLIVREDNTCKKCGASPSCHERLNNGTEDNSQEWIEYTIYPEAHSF
ncbi:MAG: prepilin-type N-terminal cleavage/methylation domain-containing protein [Candidatus Omnitrophica bacterium]|nr:prepilin-type N-terminal cleavage/methylation domain-containing protein [Candidatus Omnitrophota bacterium]